jgi:hypothetical protein
MVVTVARAVWGRALSCCKRTLLVKSPRRFDLTAGQRWFFKRSEYEALVIVFSRGVECSKSTPRSSQKRVSIIFPADGSVRNFLGFGATYRILSIALVTCLPTYRTMARYFEFLSQFYRFHLTHLRIINRTDMALYWDMDYFSMHFVKQIRTYFCTECTP